MSYLCRHCGLFLLLICYGAAAQPELVGAGLSAAPGNASGLNVFAVNVLAVPADAEDDYYLSLLRLVLNASKQPHEQIELRFSDRQFNQWRWLVELSHQTGQENSLLWTVTTTEREQLLHPVRVPLFKGLMGIRLMVIRREDVARFHQMVTLNDLQRLVAGQGANWPDLEVFKENSLPVTEGGDKAQLYRMLAAKRFDYFPRSVIEIANEREFLARYDLVVAPKWYLSYPAAIQFFVSKNNEALAHRLESGFELLIDSGEFDRFFYNHPRVKQGLPYLQGRQPIRLLNQALPKTVPINNPRYWHSIPVLLRFATNSNEGSQP